MDVYLMSFAIQTLNCWVKTDPRWIALQVACDEKLSRRSVPSIGAYEYNQSKSNFVERLDQYADPDLFNETVTPASFRQTSGQVASTSILLPFVYQAPRGRRQCFVPSWTLLRSQELKQSHSWTAFVAIWSVGRDLSQRNSSAEGLTRP